MPISREIYSVSEVNQLIATKIENDLTFQFMLIEGEIVNYKLHSSGHMYFTLKDQKSRLRCVMFSSQARYLKFVPGNGQRILVQGRISVYEKYGEYQLYADSLYQLGVGNLREKYLQLKNKLAKEGYFESEHKKDIPKFPHKIAVITSPTGAVIHDIIRTVKERYPLAEIILFPASVQGENALSSILKSFEDINHVKDIEVIILGRGGGSEEDLWTFNEELLVKKIFNSKIPIITAIGHEIDITLSDLAADISVATPTAAAVAATPDIIELFRDFDYHEDYFDKKINIKLEQFFTKIRNHERFIKAYEPSAYLNRLKKTLDLKSSQLNYFIDKKFSNYNNMIENYKNKLDDLYNQKAKFPKVYKDENNISVDSVSQVELGDLLNIILKDGVLKVKTLHKEVKKHE